MIKYLETIIESGIFKEIDKNDYIRAFEELSVRGKEFKKGGVVFYEGDTVDKLCLANKGSIRSEEIYSNGEIHIVDIYEKGAIFALEVTVSMLKTAPMDYVCNEDSIVVTIPFANIEKAAYRNEIMVALLQKLADENIKQRHKIKILAEKRLRNRILAYLNVLRKKSGSSIVTVKLNREQMASYLCVNRSALSNELSKMKREGIIDFYKDQFKLL